MKYVENIIYLTLRSWKIKYEKDGLNGLEQVLEKIKKEQTEDLIILHTDQGSVYSSESYNKLIEN